MLFEKLYKKCFYSLRGWKYNQLVVNWDTSQADFIGKILSILPIQFKVGLWTFFYPRRSRDYRAFSPSGSYRVWVRDGEWPLKNVIVAFEISLPWVTEVIFFTCFTVCNSDSLLLTEHRRTNHKYKYYRSRNPGSGFQGKIS